MSNGTQQELDPAVAAQISALQAKVAELEAQLATSADKEAAEDVLPASLPNECNPDVWDSTGRLVSSDHLNAV